MQRHIIAYFLLVLLLAGCSPAAGVSPEQTVTPALSQIQTPTLEMNVYSDHEFGFRVGYPAGWVEVAPREFRGEDGYLRITNLEDHHSLNPVTVAVDYANTEYGQFNPVIQCLGVGPHGCAIFVEMPDSTGETLERVILVVPVRSVSSGADYVLMETTRPYAASISSSIDLNEDAFVPAPTLFPTPAPYPIRVEQNGFTLVETSSQETIDPVDGLSEVVNSNCGGDGTSSPSVYSVSVDDQNRITVQKSGEPIFQYSSWVMEGPVPWTFCAWNDHWMMETQGIVVIDGEIFNHEVGYEEVFGWRLLGDTPVYFVEKDGKIRISIDGDLMPVEYDEVTHYACCDLHGFNLHADGTSAQFYAKRDGVWYVVFLSAD